MEIAVLGAHLAVPKDIAQRNGGITNLVVNQGVLVNGPDIKFILTGADIEAKSLVEDGVEALGVLGTLLVSLLEPHLDKGVGFSKEILVSEIDFGRC